MTTNERQQRTHLSAEQKRLLLEQLLNKRQAEMSPLSYGQQALWFFDQLAPGSGTYNEALSLRIRGNCDISVLQRCFQELVDRHPMLRTIYMLHGQKPVQQVLEQHRVHFTVTDTTRWSAEEREQYLQEEIYQPINLEQGPILRVQVLKVQRDEILLVLIVHHLAIDAWSLTILLDELTALYGAYSAGKPSPLPLVDVQYQDYVRWQETMLASPRGEALQVYWEQQLRGPLPVLQLPTDHPRPAIQTFTGATHAFALGGTLSQQLKTLAGEHNTTLYTLLLSAFEVLLFRSSGQTDILINSPTSGRTLATLDKSVGYYVNPVALRARLGGNPVFRTVLSQTHQTLIEALDHQDYPFSLLVSRLQPQRDPSRAPLCDVAFVMEQLNNISLSSSPTSESSVGFFGKGTSGAHFRMGELDAEMVISGQQRVKFDLSLEVATVGETISCGFQYATALFEATTIARFAEHFQCLLQGIVNNVDQPIALLPLYTDQERDRLLKEWNQTSKAYPHEATVTQLFDEQVALTPDAIALVWGDQQVSYSELERRSAQVARYLQARGVGPEVAVGVWDERSPAMLVAVLGILKAGGVYVPLDERTPLERLRFQCTDAEVRLLLVPKSQGRTLEALAVPLVCFEHLERENAPEPASVRTATTAQSLAYVMYTSGSTGLPKGVAVPHRAIVRLVRQQNFAHMGSQEVFLQLAPLAFDASTLEIWGSLLNGGRLVLYPEAVPGLDQLGQVLQEEGVSILWLTAGLFQQVVERVPQVLRGLRQLLAGGDVLNVNAVRRALQEVKVLVNGYGPTENTTFTTCYRLEQQATVPVPVPIGTPIMNTTVYVLDEEGQLVPRGAIGELYTGGDGLARGYIQQPALTAERFVPDPFSTRPGAHLYRTGDLVRYREDGQLEFVGRRDHQVKIRGFRIELGEIESALEQQEAIREAVVLVHKDAPGGQRLVAYLVPTVPECFSWEEVQAGLRAHLPDYMIPAIHIELERFPLTSNNKIDRRALPAPDYTRLTDMQHYTAPQTEIEQRLVEIWQQVLGIKQIGIHDNFFALGGDSILSIQVVSRARLAGLALTPRQLFQQQTIAELAVALQVETRPAPIEGTQGPAQGEVPLTPIQHWFFEQQQPDPAYWNQAILLQVAPELDQHALRQALVALIQLHDNLRLRFEPTVEGWRQYYTAEIPALPLLRLDLTACPQESQAQVLEVICNQVQASLHLTQGPLWRVVHLDLGREQNGRLFLVLHHLIVDGVSWRILLEDLQLAYAQIVRDEMVQLPARTTSWQQWSQRLQDYAQGEEMSNELEYWLQQAQLPPSNIRVADPAGENTVASAEHELVTLSREETHALLQDVPVAYQTQINDVLLTALALALQQWTGEDAHWIDLEGHGREDIFADSDLSRTVGWFTSLYPVRLDLDMASDAGMALKRIKEQLRAIPNRGLGYGIARYLREQDERVQALRAQMQPAISFNYLGQFDQLFNEQRLFRLASEASGWMVSPRGKRTHLIEINGRISGGQLQLVWSYSRNIHHREQIQTLVQTYAQALRTLIAHCQTPGVGGYTPSDFPLARLTQEQLDTIVGSRHDIEALYPLSPLQQGLHFQSLYAPGEGDYITQVQLTVQGPFNIHALEAAWQQVIQRHAILRTAFVWEGLERPLQIVHQHVALPFMYQDWREYSCDEQEQLLQDHLHTDRRQGCELSRAPLMRVVVTRLEDERWALLWTHHHLLLDGWSLPIIVNELFTAYEQMSEGKMVQWAPVRPYQDYIVWLEQQDVQKAEAFWRHWLDGVSAPTIVSHEPAPEQSSEKRCYQDLQLQLSSAISEALQALARKHHLTVNTVVMGAWALLLARYSGQDDVIFGTTVAGRPLDIAGVEQMVGLFINTLPMRVRMQDDMSLLVWLQALQEQQSELRQYEHSSLVQIQGWSQVPRGTSLFECLFVFENYPLPYGEHISGMHSFAVTGIQAVEQTHYPLTLTVLPRQQLVLRLSYDQGRFMHEEMHRVLRHWLQLLEGIVAHPEQSIGQLPLLTEAERFYLITERNQTSRAYPQEATVTHLFDEQVALTPDAIALVWEGQQVSYGELDRRATQVAHSLQARGVGPEVAVGVWDERSPAVLIALLGILKAGGVYVPLDARTPLERLRFQCADAGVRLLLVPAAQDRTLQALAIPLVCFEHMERESSPEPASVHSASTALSLAYVMYTSGSTGTPKGVAVPHRAIVRLVRQQNFAQMGSEEVFLQLAPLAFDASTLEIWGSLLNGGRLVLYPEAVPGLDQLGQVLQEEGVNILFLTTVLFNQIVDQVPQALRGIRQLMTGGEIMNVNAVRRALQEMDVLMNVYGPTENTTFTSYYRIEQQEEFPVPVPIGAPIMNTTMYVLDDEEQLVPQGAIGELYTGGDGLARGYIQHPALTAERFVPDPFGPRPGARLYRTGDLVRYREDGQIEFVGRRDHQVKIRGFRIELGEIETLLSQHPAISDSVVLLQLRRQHDPMLVAYFTSKHEQPPAREELQSYLQQLVPGYMVPSVFVLLESMPLTPNGKIDRRQLQNLEIPQQQSERAIIAPRTPLETLLVQIWQEVLQEESIGITDNFFERGGHSLLATSVVSRLRQELQRDVPIRLLFAAPTIASLAQEITQQIEGEYNGQPPLVVQTRPEHLPLSFAQERLWFLAQLDTTNPFYNILGALKAVGPLSVEALEKSLAGLIQRHESLRTTFVVRDSQLEQVIATELRLPPRVVDLRDLDAIEQERQVELLTQQEARLPFDLEVGPLVRWCLLRLSEQQHILILIMHHIISDGWSMGVLTRELATLYRDYLAGTQDSSLPALPIQYADFTLWQHQWLQGEVLQKQLGYWQEQLKGAPEVFSFPTDRPRPTVQSYRGSQEVLVVPASLTQALKELSQREEVTLFMLLLAAYQVLLMRYSGQTDILVGMPVANRTHPELEALIGFFVNMLVIRTDLSGNPTFRQVLKRVRETTLEAHAHQDLPFEKLVDALQITRSPAYEPLVQTCIVLQNIPPLELTLPEVSFEPILLERTTSKFDLQLDMTETPQGIHVTVEYSSDLFEASMIQRLLRHWQRLLEGIVARPEQFIEQIPLLTDAERTRVITELNQSTRAYPHEATVTQLFNEQVALVPDAIALVWEEQQISYGELDRRATQVAHSLQARGVGPEVAVGLWAERCPAMLIAMLGILKAGGIYVPLDGRTPLERLRFQCADTQVCLLLLPQARSRELEALAVPMVWYEDLERDVPPGSAIVHTATSALSLAYVMYTSGSTGLPKGVAVPHRAIVRLIRQQDFAQMGSQEVFLQLAPLAFDASTLELWGSLLNGGRLVLYPEAMPDLDQLERVIQEEGISVLWLTTGLFQQVVEQIPQALRGVRQVLTGGEVLNINAAQRALQEVEVMVNAYGPTENTTFTTCYRIEQQEELLIPVPIGVPIKNTTVYVLDDEGEVVPQGAIGELWTGGDGLARGYVQQPALTAERFVPDPFSTQPGARLYRTGDLVRYREDGQIEFVGRRDHQVKIHGFRIELGEIEALLSQHPGVQESVAMVYEEVPDDRRLVAYVVPAYEQLQGAEETETWENDYIEQWQDLYEDLYHAPGELDDPTFNISGWNSSYTGQPIPAEDMREQVEQTVARILLRHPEHVLEVGFGTGLLLFRIAPFCQAYLASDFSREALAYVRHILTAHPCPQVTLALQKAHETLQVPPGTFDTILLNSVIQYFPDIHYTVQILTDALAALAPGGFLFLGDLRNQALHRVYCTSVELYRASATATRKEVRRAAEQRLLDEEELLIDPAFFVELQRALPQIGQVQILLKRGHAHNELTRFRYDVVIRKAATEEPMEKPVVWHWRDEAITGESIAQFITEQAPALLQIRAVPNRRLLDDLQAVAWVFGGQGPEAVHEWRAEIELQRVQVPDPEEFWTLGERLGYQVNLYWSMEEDGGCFDVCFSRAEAVQVRDCEMALEQPGEAYQKPRWSTYANNPLQSRTKSVLIPQLRSFLKTQLAEYALPSHYIVLETLPLMTNGKIDRGALPTPRVAFIERETTYVAPQTPFEEFLAQLWSDVLHVERVGMTDNFFDLGGNSFTLMNVAQRLREAGFPLSVQNLFEYQTIAEIQVYVDQIGVDIDEMHMQDTMLNEDWFLGDDLPLYDLER